ncbi:hypothetical protein [Methyloceanibacter sp.]|uniref:hypothetical protein n=1 Tax=Methyloceanibacter sp. TaxID=1965321 RepID=UPI003D6D5F16
MRLLIAVFAVLVLCGCAAQNEISRQQREAESNAPDLSFQGPLRSVNLAAAQVKLVQKGIAASLKDPASASFGTSYRAGTNKDREIAVCGFVNGKRFVGMFAKPEGGSTEFLPIKVAESDEEQPAVRDYCRADGVYLPQ